MGLSCINLANHKSQLRAERLGWRGLRGLDHQERLRLSQPRDAGMALGGDQLTKRGFF